MFSIARHSVIKLGTFSFLLRLANLFLGFAVAVFLSRILGSSLYGEYTFIISIVAMASIPSQIGVPELVMRETAKYVHSNSKNQALVLWAWADRVILWSSLVLAFCACAWIFLWKATFYQSVTVVIGLLLVVVPAIVNTKAAALRGMGNVILGLWPSMIIQPVGFLFFLLSVFFIFPTFEFTPANIMAMNIGAACVALAIVIFWLRKIGSLDVGTEELSSHRSRAWISSASILGMTSGLQMINSNLDILMLGYWREPQEVGIYKIAVLTATAVGFGQQIFAAVMLPRFAALFAARQTALLQKTAILSARLATFVACVAGFGLFLFGEFILKRVFGTDFGNAYLPMMILIVGQIANSFFGLVGGLLNMTGHEKDTIVGVGLATISNLVLNAILIPHYGMVGAAVATTFTYFVWNIVLTFSVRRRLGIYGAAIFFR